MLPKNLMIIMTLEVNHTSKFLKPEEKSSPVVELGQEKKEHILSLNLNLKQSIGVRTGWLVTLCNLLREAYVKKFEIRCSVFG